MEAVLPEMVRRGAAVGAGQLPENRRTPEFDSERQGRDVRQPAARRQTGAAPRSLCRFAALSFGTAGAEIARRTPDLHPRRTALLERGRRPGVRPDLSALC